MIKILLYDMKDRFNIHDILQSQSFEPVFEDWNPLRPEPLTQYRAVGIYLPVIDMPVVRKIRARIGFRNIQLIVFSDSLDPSQKEEAQLNGADVIEEMPQSEQELIPILKRCQKMYERSRDFDDHVLKPFRLSIQEIFQTMVLHDLEEIETYRSSGMFHFGDVTARMTLDGDCEGGISLTMDEPLARIVISSIMGRDPMELEESEILDGAGELINMIAGGAKARLSQSDWHFSLSSPTVETGQKQTVFFQQDIPCAVMVFTVDSHFCALNLCTMSIVP